MNPKLFQRPSHRALAEFLFLVLCWALWLTYAEDNLSPSLSFVREWLGMVR